MTELKNQWLEKYEIKKPDYDLIERKYNPLADFRTDARRYVFKDGCWVAKQNTGNSAKIMFTGDITCFEKQFEAAASDGTYDFNYEFDCIRSVFDHSDLLVGNLETMIFPNAPYRTEKYVAEQNFHCNAPPEFLDAVRNAGFDVLTNANNHDMDTGAVGIGETADYIERFGFIHTGTFTREDAKRYQLISVNAIKVAIVAFATEHNNKRCNLTKEGASVLLNDYSRKRAKTIASQARADGADVIFCCIHWGQENKKVHNKTQQRIAGELAAMGYDCIIGSHPHVLQDFDYIVSGDKRVPVFYSLGNFVSHNSIGPKSRTAIACVDVSKDASGVSLKCTYVPAFTSKSYDGRKYVVLPLKLKGKTNAKKLSRFGAIAGRIFSNPAYRNIIKRMDLIAGSLGDGICMTDDIHYPDYYEDICEDKDSVPAPKKPVINGSTQYPLRYDNGDYVYSLYADYAVLEGFSKVVTNSYTLPAEVLDLPITKVADFALSSTSAVKKINFKKNLKSISKGMCKDCSALEGFQMTESVQEICDKAFEGCTVLSAVVVKSGVERIGSKAFSGCTDLRTVKFKSEVCDIAPDAFEGCKRAVFYCRSGSSAEQYAMQHGFKVVNMVVE